MVIAGLVLAGIAALVHGYIFYMESLAWTAPRTRATFRTSPADAETTKSLAFNQGFYNLFLAIAVALGIVLFTVGSTAVGATLVFTGTGSMVAAALVLVLHDRPYAKAAMVQGVVPALAVIALAVGLAA